MKYLSAFALLLLTTLSSLAQQALINPTSITLTQPGSVTIIVTDAFPTTEVATVTIGNIQAGNWIVSSSNSSGSITVGNGAASGTLDAGTYSVDVTGNPQQVTVILWNESGNGVSISQVALVSTSDTTADQISFRAFIASQAQQQIAVLQIQIASLQQSEGPYTDLVPMQQQLVNLQSEYDELTGILNITAVVTAQNGQNGAPGADGRNSDDTLTYAAIGIGSAAFIGTMVNFFVGDDSKGEPQASDAPAKNESK